LEVIFYFIRLVIIFKTPTWRTSIKWNVVACTNSIFRFCNDATS